MKWLPVVAVSLSLAPLACAAISGLDALGVSPDVVDGGTPSDATVPSDVGSGTDTGSSDAGAEDRSVPDGGGSDAAQSDTGGGDVGTDAGGDTGVESGTDRGILCGGGIYCTGTEICCFVGTDEAHCTASNGCSGLRIVCDDRHECPAPKLCCAQWSAGANTETTCQESCAGAFTLCDPADLGSCPSGHACTLTITTRGVTYHYCN